MAFHQVPFVVEVKLKGDHEGDPRITVIHYRYGPVGAPRPSLLELQDLCAAVIVNVLLPLQAVVTTQTRWTSVSAQDIHDANGLFYERVLNPVLYGLRGGDPLPGNVNVVIAKKTTLAQRRGRGRLFVMDLSESDVSDAVVQASLQSLLVSLAAAVVRNEGILRNFVAVVASKKFGSWAPIVSVTFDLITDSLRTRLKNHRRHRHHP